MPVPNPNRLDPELARHIVESAVDFAIITTAIDGRVTSWNAGAEKLFGWQAAEAIGMDLAEIFTPEDRETGAPEHEMTRAVDEGRGIDERWHVRRDGSRFWGSGLVMPLHGGGLRGFVKIIRDRTAERDAERRYHAMTAALPGFVFVTDPDGANTETNEQFRAYAGRSEAELNGNRWLEVLHPDDRARAAEIWATAVETGAPYEARYRFRRHDGEYRCFACRGVPDRDEAGRITRWLGTCIDVENEARARAAIERLAVSLEHRATRSDADLNTAVENLENEIAERAKIEDALRQAQKMEAIGQLTGGVAHDFNNLLTIIRSGVDLLRRRELPAEKRRQYIDAISDTVDRAAALTRQLLAFARRQLLQPELFDADQRVRQIASLMTATLGSRIRLQVEVTCADCTVRADPNQFDTAVLNLAVNARDAMDGEGELTIRVAFASGLPSRRGHAFEASDFIAVSMTDTGTGIEPDRIGRIFEPFYTTKDVGRGTGLGLSQVIGFAKQSGGDVVVDSEVGRGTTFTLYLPHMRAEQGAGEAATPAAAVEFTPGKGCVLVVEDNEAVGGFAAKLLEDLGYTTRWAESAQAALDLVAEQPDRFDLVFSDVVMPGMGGVELAQRLREERPDLPVVLTSGYAHVLAEEGTHGFRLLHKPYSVEALSRVLRQVADGSD
ncbi:hybrid sensor histidine kinase/response regulator [Sphingomonas lenta]|uniref:histidine kinase n=1 Tax=Sphingomonas lenta TaxID=1141887 RepID=A0A2A2SIB9_9SPHN|nr:PAS domain S-box protein [Sphingomonas lenta]PAX08986.1 hybrid sensor histidine kinase/response regulator [Sphingomonas lenta]